MINIRKTLFVMIGIVFLQLSLVQRCMSIDCMKLGIGLACAGIYFKTIQLIVRSFQLNTDAFGLDQEDEGIDNAARLLNNNNNKKSYLKSFKKMIFKYVF